MFGLSLYFLVFSETQFMNWIPIFCTQIIKITPDMQLQLMIPVLVCMLIGRFLASLLLRTMSSLFFLILTMLSSIAILFFITRFTHNIYFSSTDNWLDVPDITILIPILGFFWSPIFPTINAIVLYNVQSHQHNMMIALIAVITYVAKFLSYSPSSYVFNLFSPQVAFFFSSVTVSLLLITTVLFINDLRSSQKAQKNAKS
jgi:fucose permease